MREDMCDCEVFVVVCMAEDDNCMTASCSSGRVGRMEMDLVT